MHSIRYILNAAGEPEPCDDILRWAKWFKTAERRVAQDMDEGHDGDDAGRVRVSTVFLGLDHNFDSSGPPILWETLVFGGVMDGEMQRYSSLDAAIAGHQDICQQVAATIQRTNEEKAE
jgi:hypothetical protein